MHGLQVLGSWYLWRLDAQIVGKWIDYMDDGMVTFSFAKQHSTTFASIKYHCGDFGSYDLCGSYIYSSPTLVIDTGEDGETLLGSRTDATLEQSPDLIWSVSCELQLVWMAYSRMRPATLETLHWGRRQAGWSKESRWTVRRGCTTWLQDMDGTRYILPLTTTLQYQPGEISFSGSRIYWNGEADIWSVVCDTQGRDSKKIDRSVQWTQPLD